ncbi:RnfH family protein [Thalassotalea sp. HSM 43]|uniref:RnfH family protein n=1 Tax=Thalassotalea sp. HSM 43 TaxID=2552945 RepID=UPI001080FFE3|nr:RnfH family protein [Thalassotalea sp. HSM 43]QBY03396.1 RnfH family protein [Thalassotalea sp. HSM 43]
MIEQISIELVYALPTEQTLISLLIDENSTVEQAIMESGICQQFPEIDLTVNKVGIWNKAVKLQQTVHDGDRIEIYRPLIADPKEVRKRRAEKAKQEGRADKVTGGRVNPLRGAASKE